MRKLSGVLLLLFLVGTAASAKPVVDPQKTFRIDVPETWTVQTENAAPDNGQPVYTVRLSLTPPHPGAFIPNVGIQILHTDTNLTATTKSQFKQGLLQLAPQLQLGHDTTVELGGIPAWRVPFQGQIEQNSVVGYSLLASQKGWTWIVTVMAASDEYRDAESRVDAILKTFEIL